MAVSRSKRQLEQSMNHNSVGEIKIKQKLATESV
jgi:hypothetical protein